MIARAVQGKILVFVIFLIGIATGVLATNLYTTRVNPTADSTPENRGPRTPRDREGDDLSRMAKYLGLDQAQQEQIRKILEETRSEYRQLQDQTQPQFKALQERNREKIRAVLTEEQRRKSDAFWESRNKRDRDRRPPRSQDRYKDKN